MFLFGGVSILSGLLVSSFPETFNIKLPETIEEAENIGKVKEEASNDHKLNVL